MGRLRVRDLPAQQRAVHEREKAARRTERRLRTFRKSCPPLRVARKCVAPSDADAFFDDVDMQVDFMCALLAERQQVREAAAAALPAEILRSETSAHRELFRAHIVRRCVSPAFAKLARARWHERESAHNALKSEAFETLDVLMSHCVPLGSTRIVGWNRWTAFTEHGAYALHSSSAASFLFVARGANANFRVARVLEIYHLMTRLLRNKHFAVHVLQYAQQLLYF